MNPGLGVRNGELSFLNGSLGADTLRQGSRLTPASVSRTLQPRCRRSWARRFKAASLECSEPGEGAVSDSSTGASWKSPRCSSQGSRAALDSQLHLPSPHLQPGTRVTVLSQSNSFERLEAETNVDTGFTVVNSEPRQPFLSRFPRDLGTSQLPSCLPASSLGAAASKNSIFKKAVHPLPLAGQRNLGTRKIISKCPLHLPIQGEDTEGEEFFI